MTAEEQKMVDMLVQTNHELAAQVQELSNRIAQLQRMLFGRRSEKLPVRDPNQLDLFDASIAPEVVQAQEAATAQIEQETPEEKKQKLRDNHKGGPQIGHKVSEETRRKISESLKRRKK